MPKSMTYIYCTCSIRNHGYYYFNRLSFCAALILFESGDYSRATLLMPIAAREAIRREIVD